MSNEDIAAEIRELQDRLMEQGLLDDQFTQLQQLQDDSNPQFVQEVIGLFFDDSTEKLEKLDEILAVDDADFKTVDGVVHQLKGCSASIGAPKVAHACIAFRKFCEEKDVKGCREKLKEVKEEYALVKKNLTKLLELEAKLLNSEEKSEGTGDDAGEDAGEDAGDDDGDEDGGDDPKK
eukprot:jgi/Mesvir1/10132/Mv06764-RA.1